MTGIARSRWFRLFAAAVVALTAACSGDDGDDATPTTAAEEATTTTAGVDAQGRPTRLDPPEPGTYNEHVEETGAAPVDRTVVIATVGTTPSSTTQTVTRPDQTTQVVFSSTGITEMPMNELQVACARPIQLVAFPLEEGGSWDVDSSCTVPIDDEMVNVRIVGTSTGEGWGTATTGDGQSHDVWRVKFAGTFEYTGKGTVTVTSTAAYTARGLAIEDVTENTTAEEGATARQVTARLGSVTPAP